MSNALNKMFQTVADLLITSFGNSANAVVVTKGDYDAETDTQDADTEALVPISASPPAQYSIDRMEDTSIKREDFYVLVPFTDLSTELKTQIDRIDFVNGELSGRKWTLVKMTPIYGGNEPSAWECQLRP